MRRIALLAALLAPGIAPAARAAPAGLRVVDTRGFRFVEADLAKGTLSLALPGDIAAGDAVSGRLSIEAPDGADVTPASVRVAGETFRASRAPSCAAFRVPPDVASIIFEIVDDAGAQLASGQVPVAAKAVAPAPAPAPLPTIVPRRNLFVLEGALDGDLRTTDVRVGTEWLTPWAESPRRAILVGPRDLVGRHPIDVGDEGWTAHGTVDVVGVEVDPRRREVTEGQSVAVSVRVSGLASVDASTPILVDLDTWMTGEAPTTQELLIEHAAGAGEASLTRRVVAPGSGTLQAMARLRNEVSRAAAATPTH